MNELRVLLATITRKSRGLMGCSFFCFFLFLSELFQQFLISGDRKAGCLVYLFLVHGPGDNLTVWRHGSIACLRLSLVAFRVGRTIGKFIIVVSDACRVRREAPADGVQPGDDRAGLVDALRLAAGVDDEALREIFLAEGAVLPYFEFLDAAAPEDLLADGCRIDPRSRFDVYRNLGVLPDPDADGLGYGAGLRRGSAGGDDKGDEEGDDDRMFHK